MSASSQEELIFSTRQVLFRAAQRGDDLDGPEDPARGVGPVALGPELACETYEVCAKMVSEIFW